MFYPVILCGGSGTRLWPLSRELYPKQFANLGFGRTLFSQTLDRAKALTSRTLLIVCNEEHRYFVAADLLENPCDHELILEPCVRNTAPAIALAAFSAKEKDENAILLVMPSDHQIEGREFSECIYSSLDSARKGKIVTFGITATFAATQYGYIKKGKAYDDSLSFVSRFVEKPDLRNAEAMLREGDYLWNSGIFLLRADVYLRELKEYAPRIWEATFRAWEGKTRKGSLVRPNGEEFAKSPSDSIDYCVMMQTKNALVAPFNAQWSDLGSWDALYRAQKKDENGNVVLGDVIQENTKGCYFHAENKLIAALDVEDLIVVASRDAVFVSPRGSAEKVKVIVGELQAKERRECRLHPKVYRPWGSYETLAISERFQVKRIVVSPLASLSLQMHYHRAEHWVIVSGTAEVYDGKNTQLYTENQSTYIPVGAKHRLRNPGRIPLVIIEIQSGSYLGEEDIVRFDDEYDRS